MRVEGSKLLIIPYIDNNAPSCVVYDVADSMRYKVDKKLKSDAYIDGLLNGISIYSDDRKIKIIVSPDGNLEDTNENLSVVAKLINPKCQWDKKSLQRAFNHYIEIRKTKSCDITNVEIGDKTPENPLSYDSSILYRLCYFSKLDTHRDMDVYDMYELLKLNNRDKSDVINELMKLKKNKNGKNVWDRKKVEKKVYEELFPRDINKRYIQTYNPLTHEEAIVMARVGYKVNISYSSSPLDEYFSLRNNIENYVPSDKILLDIFKRDPRYIINTQIYWCPYTLHTYSSISKKTLAINEGDSSVDLDELTDKLHIWIGIHPLVPLTKTKTLLYFTDFTQSDSSDSEYDDNFFTIGNLNNISSLYVVTSIELNSLFSKNKSFSLPNNTNYYFPEICIEKLLIWCDNDKGTIDSPSYNLKNTINYIKNLDSVNNHIITIGKLCEKDKEDIKNYLYHIMELAFYMRGWKVGNNKDLPLTSEQTQTYSHELEKIEKLYIEKYLEIDKYYNGLSEEIKNIVKTIYLMKRVEIDDETKIVRSTSSNMGLTIMERLVIVMKGEEENSCIRLSSNYLLYSVWYYISSIYNEIPFDLKSLSHIS